MWLRIGIHLGDIIVQGDGIYGDGVNVAARVQDKAEPGGINITEQVFLQIEGKVDVAMEPLGKLELKNIRNPPSLYRLQLEGSPPQPRPTSRRVAVIIAVGSVGLAWGSWLAVRGNLETATRPAAPLAESSAAPPIVVPPMVAPLDKKALAGKNVAEAMSRTGQARVDLLRQALQLDPDNGAVQNLLASAVAAPPPDVPTTTSVVPPAPSVAAPAAAPKGPVHGKSKQGADDSGIRRVIVE